MKTIRIYFHLICVFAIGGFILATVSGFYKIIAALVILMIAIAAVSYLTRRR